MSQQSRRHDPYPWTWEIPLGIALVILMVLVCGVHLGRGIANVLAGAGWAFDLQAASRLEGGHLKAFLARVGDERICR